MVPTELNHVVTDTDLLVSFAPLLLALVPGGTAGLWPTLPLPHGATLDLDAGLWGMKGAFLITSSFFILWPR